jgi:hypothetical protein
MGARLQALRARHPGPDGRGGEARGRRQGGREGRRREGCTALGHHAASVQARLRGYLDNRRTHLYVFELATKALTQITLGDYDDSEPAWSPDGHDLAFTSNRTDDPDSNEDTDIWRASVDAPNEPPVRVGSSKGADSEPVWSPDGRWIAYASAADTAALVYATAHLAIAPAMGGEAKLLTQSLDRPVSAPHFANDGRSIYCLVEDEREHYLARVDARDGRLERVIHGARVANAYDLGRDGTIAALVSDPLQYGELFTLKGSRLTQRTYVNSRAERAHARLQTPIDYPSADGIAHPGLSATPPGRRPGSAIRRSSRSMAASQYDLRLSVRRAAPATAGYVVLLPNLHFLFGPRHWTSRMRSGSRGARRTTRTSLQRWTMRSAPATPIPSASASKDGPTAGCSPTT